MNFSYALFEVIALTSLKIMRCFDLYVKMDRAASRQLEDLFELGHSLTLAHIILKHLLISLFENVYDFFHIMEVVVQFTRISSVEYHQLSI